MKIQGISLSKWIRYIKNQFYEYSLCGHTRLRAKIQQRYGFMVDQIEDDGRIYLKFRMARVYWKYGILLTMKPLGPNFEYTNAQVLQDDIKRLVDRYFAIQIIRRNRWKNKFQAQIISQLQQEDLG